MKPEPNIKTAVTDDIEQPNPFQFSKKKDVNFCQLFSTLGSRIQSDLKNSMMQE